MKKPMPEDFGMTSEQYHEAIVTIAQVEVERRRRRKVCDRWTAILILLAWLLALGSFGFVSMKMKFDRFFGLLAFFATIVGMAYIVVAFSEFYVNRESNSIARMRQRIHPYEKATERYQSLQERHWLNLRGVVFEKKLGGLYRKLGYEVTETIGSHDAGVDLYLSKDGKTLIVQCKGHKKPIGIAAARDLYGTFVHQKVDGAVLACPAGFTDGVRTFTEGKSIELISAKELVAMEKRVP